MSNDNGSGWFGGLILGAGFAGLLLLPIVLMRKFGIGVMSVVSAAGMTLVAAVQPHMLAWLTNEIQYCSGRLCPALTLYGMFDALPALGWWVIALGGWLIVFLRAIAATRAVEKH